MHLTHLLLSQSATEIPHFGRLIMNNINKKGPYSTLIKLVVKNTDQKDRLRAWKPMSEQDLTIFGKKKSSHRFEKQRLQSYLSVCVHSGHFDKAITLLLRSKHADTVQYNTVLKGLARSGQFAQLQETREAMLKNKIKTNDATFAIGLLSFARSDTFDEQSLRKIMDDMKEQRVDATKIFQSTYFNEEERLSVRNLIRRLQPDYDDKYLKISTNYDCNLLKDLKRLNIPYDIGGIADVEELKSLAERQRNAESQTCVVVKSVANSKITSTLLRKYISSWQSLLELWRQDLTRALDEDLEALKKQSEAETRIHIYPYLCTVSKETLVDLMISEIETDSSFSSFSMSTRFLHLQLGAKVMKRYIKDKEEADGSYSEKQKLYDEFLRSYYSNPVTAGLSNSRRFIQDRAADQKNYAIYRHKIDPIDEWPHQVLLAVGRFLYGIILREAKFDPNAAKNPNRSINKKSLVNAFYTAYFQIDKSYKIKEEFRTHREFEKLQQKCCGYRIKFDHTHMPLYSPPYPWLSPAIGGYITIRSELIRTQSPSSDHIPSAVYRANEQKLYPSLDSLNALSLCPWIVNKDILDLVIHLFRMGGDPDLTVPYDELRMKKIAPPVLRKEASQADKILYNRDMKKYEQKKREMYSLWCDCLYRLSIANHFRDKVFWFPHNIDFRGRTYPIPPHLNHLGSDLARSLLMFAKGKPLGEKGLEWLKIHAINLGGSMKKSSLQERLDYANSILHTKILDSADNPWDGKRWWLKHENPWQVLACCKEIAKAIRSKDCKLYVSHLPVHQDGSCNGLQHYAALGRDYEGAAAVNLVPFERPQDVYSRVVDLVEKTRHKDAENGDEIAQMLDGLVQRKVIKQTVMTTVYGVTRYGARHQIARQLTAKGFSDKQIWKASSYLTTKTFESIGQMFNKSMLIQDWLNRCAWVIASRCGQPVDWETPLGLPVVQPYTKNDTLSAMKMGPDILMNEGSQVRLNPSKQKTAFPPNYVHSLDSCHMMLTSLFCECEAITFVSVHDCFWTHPSTVDEMNRICRDQFVALHSEPLLQNLGNHFVKRFGKMRLSNKEPEETDKKVTTLSEEFTNASKKAEKDQRNIFLQVPEAGKLDLNLVRDSVYFFS